MTWVIKLVFSKFVRSTYQGGEIKDKHIILIHRCSFIMISISTDESDGLFYKIRD